MIILCDQKDMGLRKWGKSERFTANVKDKKNCMEGRWLGSSVTLLYNHKKGLCALKVRAVVSRENRIHQMSNLKVHRLTQVCFERRKKRVEKRLVGSHFGYQRHL